MGDFIREDLPALKTLHCPKTAILLHQSKGVLQTLFAPTMRDSSRLALLRPLLHANGHEAFHKCS
jgi:hypothetical protein